MHLSQKLCNTNIHPQQKKKNIQPNKVNLQIVILQQQPHGNIKKQNAMPVRLPRKH